MTGVPIFGLLLGLDNLAVIAGLGLASLAWNRRVWMVGAFILFETMMPLVGHVLGAGLASGLAALGEWLGIGFLGLAAALILRGALRREALSGLVDHRWSMVLLGFLLSFDNLAAGVGFGALGMPLWQVALMLGGVSSVVCILALGLGGTVRALLPGRADVVSGGFLAAMAVVLVVDGIV